jgi:hypothetical protein
VLKRKSSGPLIAVTDSGLGIAGIVFYEFLLQVVLSSQQQGGIGSIFGVIHRAMITQVKRGGAEK